MTLLYSVKSNMYLIGQRQHKDGDWDLVLEGESIAKTPLVEVKKVQVQKYEWEKV